MGKFDKEINIVNRIFKYRVVHGLTQVQMSNMLGVSINMVGRYERGEVFPKPALVEKFNMILDEKEKKENERQNKKN